MARKNDKKTVKSAEKVAAPTPETALNGLIPPELAGIEMTRPVARRAAKVRVQDETDSSQTQGDGEVTAAVQQGTAEDDQSAEALTLAQDTGAGGAGAQLPLAAASEGGGGAVAAGSGTAAGLSQGALWVLGGLGVAGVVVLASGSKGDKTPPPAPVITAVATDDVVNAAEKTAGVTVSGTAEANAVVTVTWGNTTKTVTATGGSWSVSFAAAEVPADGSTTISAVAKDAAGNSGTAGTKAVTVDSTAPTAPVVASVAGDNVVNTAEKAAGVTVSGTAETGSSVAVTWGSVTKTVTAAGGTFSVSFAAADVPADGSSTISAVATDAAGNRSAAGTRAVSIDTAAPAAPVVAVVAGDNTVSAAEKAAGVTVSGTAEAGSSVAVTWGSVTKTVTATAGAFSASFAAAEVPADGSTTVSAVATDAAGNASASGTRTVVVDASARNAPSVALQQDTGASATDGVTKSATLAVSGLLAGATWQYSVDGGTTWTAGSGSSFTLAAGSYAAGSIRVRQTDTGGVVSAVGTLASAVTVDVTAPQLSAIALDPASDTGVQGDGRSTVATPTLVVTAEAGATLRVDAGAGAGFVAAGTATGAAQSLTLATPYAADGSYTVTVEATDLAGNVTTRTATYVLDRTAPAAPVPAFAQDTGSSSNDGVTSNGLVNVTGLEAGASWQYSVDSGATWLTGSGSSFTLAPGSYAQGSVRVRQTDVAGNTSTAFASGDVVVVDQAAPAAPVVAAIATDNIVNAVEKTAGVTVTGTAEAGASVAVTWGAVTKTVTATGGTFSASFAAADVPADGSTSISAVATDLAGNASSAGTRSVTVDTSAPAQPALALSADTGASASDGVTSNGLVNVTGLEAGASWQYSIDSGATWLTGSGSSFTAVPGTYAAGTVRVRQTDVAGNTSTAFVSSQTVVLDQTAPAAPVVNAVAGDNVVNIAEKAAGIAVSGTAEAGSSVSVTWGSVTKVVTATGGVWSANFVAADVPVAASSAITAIATDLAGNASTAGTRTVVADLAAPAVPGVSLVADTGASSSDAITQNGALTVTGIESGATWEYSTDAGTSWTAGVGSSFTLAPGNYAMGAVRVRQTDAAGNVGTAFTNPIAASVDVTAPQLPTASASGNSVTLSYAEALDAINPPAPSQFTVTLGGGGGLTVNSVNVSGNTVVLTLSAAIPSGTAFTIAYADATSGDDLAGIQDLAGNDAISFSSGVVADGYVRGAAVYIDVNGNGEVDAGDFSLGVTDASGNFFIPAGAPTGAIIATGGVNIDTGAPNTVALKAPAGSTTINPLTTLVQAVVQASGGTTDAATAAATVATNLGITLPVGSSLTNYDPISAGNLDAQKAAAQVATVVALASAGDAATASTVLGNLATEIQTAANAGTTVNLADAGTLSNVLAGTTASAEVQSSIADAASTIGSAVSFTAITSAQAQYLDKVAPNAPALSGPPLGNSATPVVRVTFDVTDANGRAAVAGDTLLLAEGEVQLASVVLTSADILAGYRDITTPTLADGSHSLSSVIIDQAGNRSASSDALPVSIDTQAPLAPTIGVVAQDDVINSSEAATVVSGYAEAGATVRLSLASQTRTVLADTAGNWTYSLTSADLLALGQGDGTLSVTATDAAGNVSAAGTRAIRIDTIAPSVTAAISGADDNVAPLTGNVASGGATNDNTLGLSGSLSAALSAGDVLAVYDGATRLGLAAVAGTTWQFTTGSLANGGHSFTVRVEDSAGNAGTASAAYAVTVDATVPTAVATIASATDDVPLATGALVSGSRSNDALPVLNGTLNVALQSGEQLVVYDGSVRLGTASVTDQAWQYAPAALAEGLHRFTAVVESAGGNQGASSAPFLLSIDTAAPDAPAFNLIAGDDVINAAEQTAVLSGRAEAGASVALTLGSVVRTVTAAANGAWSYTLTGADIAALGQGNKTLSATATDVAGNSSAAGTRAVAIDTQGPSAPVFNTVAGDNLINASELSAGVTISGTAEAGSKLALTLGSGNVRGLTVSDSGAWSYTLSAADIAAMGQGSETLRAVAVDAAGNQGAQGSLGITIDTQAPSLTAFTLVANGETGRNTANSATPSIQFTAEAGATLEINTGDGRGFVAAGVGTGAVQTLVQPTPYTADDRYTITLRATDLAGNTTTRTGIYTFDTSGPAAPSIAVVAGNDLVSAAEKSAGIAVSGTAEPGATVTVTWGAATKTVVANGGKWSAAFAAGDVPADGATVISAVARDTAGNTSSVGTRAVAVDTAAPAAPVLTIIAGDNAVNAAEKGAGVTVTGTAEAGSSVAITWGSVTKTVSAPAGAFSATFAAAELPADGSTTISAVAIDAAGNVSAAANRAVSIDTAAPAAPVISVVAADNTVNATEKAAGVTVTGTAEAGSSVVITWGSVTKTVSAAAGAFSATFAAGEVPTDGATTISAVARDAAGNTSSAGTRTVAVDTAAPAAPVLTIIAGDNTVNAAEKAAGVTVTGTAEAGSSVAITWGSVTKTVSAPAGAFSATFAAAEMPADGSNTITAVATDAAGNVSAAGSRAVTIDTTAPAAPTLTLAADTGSSNSDGLTANATVQVGGLESGASWQFSTDGGASWSAGTGNSFALAQGSYGANAIRVRQVDTAGNVGEAAARAAATVIDTAAPQLQSATANGTQLTLRFSETLDPAGVPPAGAFTVTLSDGSIRGLTYASVSGTDVVLGMLNRIPDGLTFSVGFAGRVGDATAPALRDLAGNDAVASTVTGTLGTSNAPTGSPLLILGRFTETANSTVTLSFDDAITVNAISGVSLFKGDGTAVAITGYSVANNVLTLNTATTLGAGDTLRLQLGNAALQGSTGIKLYYGPVLLGGSAADVMDGSTYANNDLTIRGNGGNDTVFGGDSVDLLFPGNGADLVEAGRDGDGIYLNESPSTPSTDTVKIVEDIESLAVLERYKKLDGTNLFSNSRFDDVFGFDVLRSGGVNNDRLDLPSGTVAANQSLTAGNLAGLAATNPIVSHSISAGIVTFYRADGTEYIATGGYNGFRNAFQYLGVNLTQAGATVGFKLDSNGDGKADSTAVYQDGAGLTSDIAVRLWGVTGVTLGNSAGQNVVQIVDTSAPSPVNATRLADSGDAMISFSEAITLTSTPGGSVLRNGTGSNILTGLEVSDNQLTFRTSGTATSGDWLLVTTPSGLKDSANNLIGGVGLVALGDNAANTINLSALANGVVVLAQDGNDTITGTAQGDDLFAGKGADSLDGGAGGDRYHFLQGDSTTVTFADNGSAGLNNGDTFTFAGGMADVITGGFTVEGIEGDRIQFDTPTPGPSLGAMGNVLAGTILGVSGVAFRNDNGVEVPWNRDGAAPADGKVIDQGYFLVRGTYAGGVFTVNTTSGTDTLMVYDGTAGVGKSDTGLVILGRIPSQLGVANDLIYLKDATPPAAPVVNIVAGDNGVNAAEKAAGVTISGTAEALSTVTVTWGTGSKSVSVSDGGAWSTSFAAGEVPADGITTLSAVARDAAGNASVATTRTLTVDTAAPAAPVVSLIQDTGYSATDGITSNGALAISGLESGAFWQYSLDNGATWITGSGSGLTVPPGSYAAGGFQVRQVDARGNLSTVASNPINTVVDQTAPQLVSIAASGNAITLQFNEALDPLHVPSASYFSVVADNGLVFQVSTAQASGQSLTLTTLANLPNTGSLTISYKDPSGANDLYAVQDLAGNDSTELMAAAVLPSTSAAATSVGTYGGLFTEPTSGNSVVKIFYSAAVTATSAAGFTIVKTDGTSIPVTGYSTAGNVLSLETGAQLTATDVILVKYNGSGVTGGSNNINVYSWNYVIGGSGASALDAVALSLSGPAMFGNDGADTFTGSSSSDFIVGGSGADSIAGGFNADTIYLSEGVAATDTVQVRNTGDSVAQGVDIKFNTGATTVLYRYDTVYGFDVSNAGGINNDRLQLPSAAIATDVGVTAGAVPFGQIVSHSISQGIATFYDAAGNALSINSAQATHMAFTYLSANLTQPGATVGFYSAFTQGEGTFCLMVFQDGVAPNEDLAVRFPGVTGVTLSNSPGQNVVQIIDGNAPSVVKAGFADGASTVQLEFSEVVSVGTGAAATVLLNGTGSSIASGVNSASGNQVSLGVNGSLQATDWLLITTGTGVSDAAGTAQMAGTVSARGGSGANTINVSGLTSAIAIYGAAGDDTLTGTGFNDTLVGGVGADVLDGGAGSDLFLIYQGDSPSATLVDVDANGTLGNGDRFTFANGVDVVAGGFSGNSDRVAFAAKGGATVGVYAMGNPTSTSALYTSAYVINGVELPVGRDGAAPSNGLATNQGYFLVRGTYAGGAFTVNTTSGSDTLVVYDGDDTAGVSQSAIVIQGKTPAQLSTSNDAIYLRTPPAAPTINVVAGDNVVTAEEKANNLTVYGSAVGAATVQVTWGSVTKTVSVVNNSWNAAFSYFEVPADGNTVISAVARDAYGNAGTAGTRAVEVNSNLLEAGSAYVGIVGASFTEGSNSTVTLVLAGAATVSATPGLSLTKADGTTIGITSVRANGNTVILETGTALAATDVVVAYYNGSNGLRYGTSGYVWSANIAIAGSAVATLDVSTLATRYYGFTAFANGASTTIIGTGMEDRLAAGNGADVITAGGGGDLIDLTESVPVADTLKVLNFWESGPERSWISQIKAGPGGNLNTPTHFYVNWDTVYGFDVTSPVAANHDRLQLPSAAIAADRSVVTGTAVGGIVSFSLASGIATFYDAQGAVFVVDDMAKIETALSFLSINLNQPGTTAAFALQARADGGGVAPGLMVYQDGVGDQGDIAIRLQGVGVATLGTTAGANVVQIVDTTIPQQAGGYIGDGGNTVVVSYNEPVVVTGAGPLRIQVNGADTPAAATFTQSGNVITATLAAPLAAADWVMVTNAPDTSGTTSLIADTSGNLANAWWARIFGSAGNNLIDRSAYTWSPEIDGGAGDDTLIGSSGIDALTGGTGADVIEGGRGADYIVVRQGDSSQTTFVDSNGSGSLNDGDRFVLAGGKTDVIKGFSVDGGASDQLQFRSVFPNAPILAMGNPLNASGPTETLTVNGIEVPRQRDGSAPSDGLAVNQGYFLVRGTYAGGEFVVNSSAGTDTLVVYDGTAGSGLSQTALVIEGRIPSQLQVDWSGISLRTPPPAPAAPTILPVAGDGVVVAAEKAAGVVISGTAAPGITVSVSWGSVTKTVASGDGNWSATFTSSEVPADGNTEVRAVASDSWGSLSPVATRAVAVQVTPAPPFIDLVAGNNFVDSGEKAAGVPVTGTAADGVSVAVTWGSTTKTAVSRGGTWSTSFAASEVPADGATSITARATDVWGSSSATYSRAVTVGASDPATPMLVSAVASGDQIRLNFSESLNNYSLPSTSYFSIRLADGTTRVADSFVQNGSTVLLYMSYDSRIPVNQKVFITYTDPTSGNDTYAVQDLTGTDVASFTAVATVAAEAGASTYPRPVAASFFEQAPNIVGTWVLKPASPGLPLSITLLADGRFMFMNANDGGVESGTYTYNTQTGSLIFNVTVDNNGDLGLRPVDDGRAFMAQVVNGKLQVTAPSSTDVTTFDAVPVGSDITGTWMLPVGANQKMVALVLLGDGTVLLGEGAGTPDDGLELGTYAYNATAKTLTLNMTYDNNPNGGGVGLGTSVLTNVMLNGNGLVFTAGAGTADQEVVSATRAFAGIAPSAVRIVFNDNVTVTDLNGLTMKKADGTAVAVAGYQVQGSVLTLFTDTVLGASDQVQLGYTGLGIKGTTGRRAFIDNLLIDGSGNGTLVLANVGGVSSYVALGNGGSDTLVGSSAVDDLRTGNGSDVIDSGADGDGIFLRESSRATDTIRVLNAETSRAFANSTLGYLFDEVWAFDVTGTGGANNDRLILPSGKIAADTARTFGTPVGGIYSHSIFNGVVSFFDQAGNPMAVGYTPTLTMNAFGYLALNLNQPGATVAFAVDVNGSSMVSNSFMPDSMMVYQDGVGPNADIAVLLRGVFGITLGNAAGQNVVQIVDGAAPAVVDGSFGSAISLTLSEQATVSGNGFTAKLNGAGADIATASAVQGATLTVSTASTPADSDWLLLTSLAGVTDSSGTALPAGQLYALGGAGNNSIDLSALGSGAVAFGKAGNDLISGTGFADVLVGGTGADTLAGGAGADHFVFAQGDSPVVTFADLGTAGLGNGDTFTFAGNAADVISSGFTVAGMQGDVLDLTTVTGAPLTSQTAPSTGLVSDQGFFLVRGTYGGGVFTVNNSSGADTLLVYDGTAGSGVSQTALVLQGHTPGEFLVDTSHLYLLTQP